MAGLGFDQVNIVLPDVLGAARFLRAIGAEVQEVAAEWVELGAECLRGPYDAFWGARYAVVRGPGPIAVGIMSPADPAARGEMPALSDFT